ncbi:hypothetical protein OG998_00040 [Streptomyces albidoflavus]|uniref:hypothetical protein n=1 Tax=Streptomyces albidoflavus TaxID=1886 RepID=UPI0038737A5F|nr:hypothetical protein OG998_00040 [Streptomyces albidoflavus]
MDAAGCGEKGDIHGARHRGVQRSGHEISFCPVQADYGDSWKEDDDKGQQNAGHGNHEICDRRESICREGHVHAGESHPEAFLLLAREMGICRGVLGLDLLGYIFECLGFRDGRFPALGGGLAGLSMRHGLGIQDFHSVPLRGDGIGVSELPAQPCAVEHGFDEEIACCRGRGIRRLTVGAERVGSGAPGRFRRRSGPYWSGCSVTGGERLPHGTDCRRHCIVGESRSECRISPDDGHQRHDEEGPPHAGDSFRRILFACLHDHAARDDQERHDRPGRENGIPYRACRIFEYGAGRVRNCVAHGIVVKLDREGRPRL